ncbi:MAG: hypothetical protein GF370_00110 [Candidatus Nealsonbacteria bacterium]|nr:hypothetical protein [Candidatus Nealsonbacteria bacterium]
MQVNTGMVYNSIVCFFTSIVSLISFYSIRKKRKEQKLSFPKSIDYFLFLFGIMWFSVGLRTFMAWLGYLSIDMIIFRWFSGTLTYLHMIPLFHYLGWSFFKDKKLVNKLFTGLTSVAIILATIALIVGGASQGEVTYWGTDPTANETAKKIFTFGTLLPLALSVVIEFIRRTKNWVKTRNENDKQFFGFGLAFLFYFLIGVFDALGGAQGWKLLMSRGGETLVPLIIYLSIND